MSKDHEQFLLKCELAKTILMEIWTKGVITDDERDRALERITKMLKDEYDEKRVKKYGSNPHGAINFIKLYQSKF